MLPDFKSFEEMSLWSEENGEHLPADFSQDEWDMWLRFFGEVPIADMGLVPLTMEEFEQYMKEAGEKVAAWERSQQATSARIRLTPSGRFQIS